MTLPCQPFIQSDTSRQLTSLEGGGLVPPSLCNLRRRWNSLIFLLVVNVTTTVLAGFSISPSWRHQLLIHFRPLCTISADVEEILPGLEVPVHWRTPVHKTWYVRFLQETVSNIQQFPFVTPSCRHVCFFYTAMYVFAV